MDDFSLCLLGEICALQLELHAARSSLPNPAKILRRKERQGAKKLTDHGISQDPQSHSQTAQSSIFKLTTRLNSSVLHAPSVQSCWRTMAADSSPTGTEAWRILSCRDREGRAIIPHESEDRHTLEVTANSEMVLAIWRSDVRPLDFHSQPGELAWWQ